MAARASSLRQVAPAAGSGVLPGWDLWFEFIARVLALAARVEDKSPLVRSVEARELTDDLEPTISTLGLSVPEPDDPESYFADLLHWLSDAVAGLAY